MDLYTYIDSPLGQLTLVSEDGMSLSGLYMKGQQYERLPAPSWTRNDSLPIFDLTHKQLGQYFDGRRTRFSLPLRLAGNVFQKTVWALLQDIPYGATATYGLIAEKTGDPSAARTIGHVIGLNPISVIVPCHRVIASNGKLTGYNGGLVRKQLLLDLETGRTQLALD